MHEFLDFVRSEDIKLPMVVFMMLFSLGISLFHSFLFSSLYNVTVRPSWLLYALYPAILLGVYFAVGGGLSLICLMVLFGGTFLLGLIGMIRTAIIGDPETKYYRSKKEKKPFLKKLIIGAGVIVFCIVFISSGPYAFIIIFTIAFFKGIAPSSKNRFKKYQATLPTSKIRSVAMGLAEVQGIVTTDKPLLARIEKKECIGYKYIVEDITKDKDGDSSYSEIFSETVCNPFLITDETGSIEVNPDNIELIWFELDGRYSTGSKRYSQYLLKQNDKVLIIGKASVRGNIPVIEHENIKNVFGVAPLEKVGEYNTYKPLLNSFALFSGVLAVMVAILLISPISIRDGKVFLQLSSAFFNWESLFNFLN